ncbi:unnamed protein product, partial [Amoebophrya sp. A25]|eukprot:GSA25T00007245001.1
MPSTLSKFARAAAVGGAVTTISGFSKKQKRRGQTEKAAEQADPDQLKLQQAELNVQAAALQVMEKE